MRDRAYRRAQADRKKDEVRRWYRAPFDPDDARSVGLRATTPKACGKSCTCCTKTPRPEIDWKKDY